MYLGASPPSALYTSSITLNWMRNLIGSQRSLMRTGVICSYFLVLDTIMRHCVLVTAALQSNPVVFQLGEHCSNPSETLTHVSSFPTFLR